MAKNTARIQCITKTERFNPHERISHVGGINPDGSRWKQTQRTVIEAIESGDWKYHVTAGGKTVNVIVATRSTSKIENVKSVGRFSQF